MKLTQLIATISAVLFAAVMTVGCAQEQGPAERTGAQIDEGIEDTQDAARDAWESIEGTAEDAYDATEEAVEDAQRSLEDATN